MEDFLVVIEDALANLLKASSDIFKILQPILIIFVLYFAFRIIYRYHRYGYREFGIFRRRNSLNYKLEMMFFMFEKMPGYRKVLVLKGFNSQIAIIDQTGIYLLYIYNHEGIVVGESNDSYLLIKSSKKQQQRVENPFMLIDADEALVKDLTGSARIHKYIVVNNTCMLTTKYNGPTHKIFFKEFFYKLEYSLKNNDKIYDKDEIVKYYKKIKHGVK